MVQQKNLKHFLRFFKVNPIGNENTLKIIKKHVSILIRGGYPLLNKTKEIKQKNENATCL